MGSQIYNYNWQRVSDELAICKACEKGWRAGPIALQHVLRLTRCEAKIILANFNLAVSTLTAKPPNLNPCQIFRLHGMLGARHGPIYQPQGFPLLPLDGKLPMSPSPLTRTVKAIWKQSGNASSSF